MSLQNESILNHRFTSKKNSIYIAFFVLIGGAIAAWLYAATAFEKNIKTIQETLVKSGKVTFSDVHIHKYALKATFENPVFTGGSADMRVQFKVGNALNIHYNFLTKTITLYGKGDETLSLKTNEATVPLIHAPKHESYNDCRYTITLAHYFPDFTNHEHAHASPDQHIANLLKIIIKNIKSIQIKGENGLIQLNVPWNAALSKPSFGSIRYKQLNYTLFPSLKQNESGAFDLHIRNRFSYTNFAFLSTEESASSSVPAQVKGKSTSIIHFGNDDAILHAIRQLNETGDWWAALTAFSTESQSKGKRIYKGQKHTYTLSTTYDAAAKFIHLAFDGHDIFDATWKHDYIPSLRSLAESYQQTFGNQKPITEAMLTAILPSLENHNPVNSTLTVHVDFKNDSVLTDVTAGYTSKRHGATIGLSLSAQKAALVSLQKLFDINDQTLETLINQPVNIQITLRDQTVLMDDLQEIITRVLSLTENVDWIKSIPTGRAIIHKSIQLIAEQSKPKDKLLPANETHLCFAYDIKTNTFTYGNPNTEGQQGQRGQGFDQLITHIMPDILQTIDFTHNSHQGHTHENNTDHQGKQHTSDQEHDDGQYEDSHDHETLSLTDGINNSTDDEIVSDEIESDDEAYVYDYANTIADDLSPNGAKKTTESQ